MAVGAGVGIGVGAAVGAVVGTAVGVGVGAVSVGGTVGDWVRVGLGDDVPIELAGRVAGAVARVGVWLGGTCVTGTWPPHAATTSNAARTTPTGLTSF